MKPWDRATELQRATSAAAAARRERISARNATAGQREGRVDRLARRKAEKQAARAERQRKREELDEETVERVLDVAEKVVGPIK